MGGGLNNRNVYLIVPEAENSKVNVLASLFLVRALFDLFSVCSLDPLFCVHRESELTGVSFYKDTLILLD